MAAESRSNHKTQGFGSAKQRGEAFEYFKTILGDAPKTALLDGVNTTWTRVNNGEEIEDEVGKIQKGFEPDSPEKSVPALLKLHDKIEKVTDVYWKTQKLKVLDDLIAACAGLWFEAYAAQPGYALGDSIPVNSQVIGRYNTSIKLNSLSAGNYIQRFGNNEDIPANQLRAV